MTTPGPMGAYINIFRWQDKKIALAASIIKYKKFRFCGFRVEKIGKFTGAEGPANK